MATQIRTKTGECYYRDDAGALWLAESFVDAKGVVTTTDTLVEQAPQEAEQP